MKKVNLLLVVMALLAIFMFTFCACHISKKSDPEPQIERDDFDIFSYNGAIADFSDFDIMKDISHLSIKIADMEGQREGLLSALDLNLEDEFDYDSTGDVWNRMGTVTLTDQEIRDRYRIVIFTSVEADQDNSNPGLSLRVNGVPVEQTKKSPEELSFETGCTIFITKIQFANYDI